MNLQDVAKKAGVSISTVSRVVNGKQHVGARTKRRVLSALKQLNYTPNLQARSLVSGRSRSIGMIVSNLENPFFIDLFHRVESRANSHGYEVVLTNTNYEPGRLESHIRLMLGRQVAGLALAVSETIPSNVEALIRAKIPVLSFGAGGENTKVLQIRFDAYKGTKKLAELLHASGHKRIAYIGYDLSLQTTDERKEAFLESARKLVFEHRYLTLKRPDGFSAGRDAVRELVRLGFRASAILCVNDVTAIGVIRELTNMSLRVPEDVSVAGFDNIALAEFCCPSLTTVHVPRELLATHLLQMIEDGPEGIDFGTPQLLGTEVVLRDSTGPYKDRDLLSKPVRR